MLTLPLGDRNTRRYGRGNILDELLTRSSTATKFSFIQLQLLLNYGYLWRQVSLCDQGLVEHSGIITNFVTIIFYTTRERVVQFYVSPESRIVLKQLIDIILIKIQNDNLIKFYTRMSAAAEVRKKKGMYNGELHYETKNKGKRRIYVYEYLDEAT